MYRDIATTERQSIKATRFGGVRKSLSQYATSGGWLGAGCMLVLGFAVSALGVASIVYGISVHLHDLLFLGVAFVCMGSICLVIALIQLCLKYRARLRDRNIYPAMTEVKETQKITTDINNYGNNTGLQQQRMPGKSILRDTKNSDVIYDMPGVEANKAKSLKLDYSTLYTQGGDNDAGKPVITLPRNSDVAGVYDGDVDAVYSVPVENDGMPHR